MEAWGFALLSPWDYNNQRGRYWLALVFSERGIFAHLGALACGTGLWFDSLKGVYRGILREWGPVDAIFVLSLCLAVAHWYCSPQTARA